MAPLPTHAEFIPLEQYLLAQTRLCLRPPVDRFRHPWMAPMPLSPAGAAYLASRQAGGGATAFDAQLGRPAAGDGFSAGDYSLGLFHHDASEAGLELVRHEEFRQAVAGSLLCLLDCALPNGRVHRSELSHKSRDAEPAKPVMAQFAERVVQSMGAGGLAWAEEHQVFPRVLAFIRYLEREYVGLHGLFLTHSSLQSGFDSDVLTSGYPDRSIEGPDTNAFMVLEYEALARLARALDQGAVAEELSAKAASLRARMEALLWYEDEHGGCYTALRWMHGVGTLEAERVGARTPDGKLRPFETWTSLMPLYAGIPSPDRARSLCRKLLRPESFWGPSGVRTAPADDLFFHQAPRVLHFDFKKNGRGPVSNWSGPVWVLSNYYLARGLALYGLAAEARELSLKTARLLALGLERQGTLHECYNDEGLGLWPRQGTFISWNVLVLTLLRELRANEASEAPRPR